jgi:hypothetical protein
MDWMKMIPELQWGFFEFRPPANPLEIDSLNKILKFEIPNDLREFYLKSNGLYGNNNGWDVPIISSIEDVTQNLSTIKSGNFNYFEDNILFPDALAENLFLPLCNDYHNGAGIVFNPFPYEFPTNFGFQEIGYYLYKFSTPRQLRAPDLTFSGKDLESYIALRLGIEMSLEVPQ